MKQIVSRKESLNISLQMFFFFQEELFLFLNLTAMHFPKPGNHFSVKQFLCKNQFPPKKTDLGWVVLMQVHRRNVIYDPTRGVNKFNPLRMGGKETK